MNIFARVLLATLGLMLLPASVSAHEMSIAEMDLREMSAGKFLWHWTARSDKARSAGELRPLWPDGCVADGNVLDCGERGLEGELSVEGVGERYSAVIVRIAWRDGQSRVYTLSGAQPDVQLFGSADDRRGRGEIASVYALLGVEHILIGIDHVMFVLCLLFLVGFTRRLVLTVTAFTVAHSLTLGLSALGWLTLRSPPVEATIALSIMLVASEALSREQTVSRRWPSLVAFLFGLIHGLGFAGALEEIGLPQQHLLVALLSFNVGVELGQLLIVGICYLLYLAVRHRPRVHAVRTPALYAIGSLAAFWSIGRILTIANG